MPTDVIMPQMGESIFEGTITKWLKQPGDQVQRDEPLFEISTDKVDAEIPAPASGVLKEIKAQAGQTVQVNTVVATIDVVGAPATATPGAKQSATEPPKPATQPDGSSAPASSTPAPSSSAASGPKTDVAMPQMGESIFEGTITKWLKNVGDTVQRDEPLFEISTDKVDAEIPAPVAGVLSEIKVPAGTTVQVNTIVATIGGEAGESTPAAPQAPVPSAPKAAPLQPAAPVADETEEEVVSASGDRVRTSPLVRKLAKEANVDLAKVRGSGMGGRITKEDIQAFLDKQKSTPAQQPAAVQPATATAPAVPATTTPVAASSNKFAGTPGMIEPMSVMRKKIADHMVMSKRTSAHVHGVFEVDFTRIVKLREKQKNSFQEKTGLKLTYTPFYARAVAHALRAWPIINASVEGENINYKKDINLGIAVALDWGLIVPVVKRADELSFVGLQRAITDLGERARAKKLKPEDVQGGTFTITNPGIFGAKFGMPIINQPQLAIMGIGAIYKVPAVVTDKEGNDSIAIRSICHISIGYDHRVIDGAVADQFMVVVKNYLENWNESLT
jgi:2-oxoglutarate dehydrogenase E2 component (dihydrolipoamide succinyltransferase)